MKSIRPQSGHSLSPGPTGEPQAGHLPSLTSSLEARISGCISMKYFSMRSCARSKSSDDTTKRHLLQRQLFLQPASERTVQEIPASMRTAYSSLSQFRSPSLTTTSFSMVFSMSRFFSSCAFLCSSGKRRTAPQSAHCSMCARYSVPQSGHILFQLIVPPPFLSFVCFYYLTSEMPSDSRNNKFRPSSLHMPSQVEDRTNLLLSVTPLIVVFSKSCSCVIILNVLLLYCSRISHRE